MRYILPLLLLFFIGVSTLAQVTIGTDSLNTKLPISTSDNYSYSQVIYPASAINASGTITSIKYTKTGTSIAGSDHWTIYMGHTSLTEFASTSSWIAVGSLTQVYANYVVQTGNEVEVILTTPFVYNGTSNLVIAIDENTATNTTSNGGYFHCSRSYSGKRTSLEYSGNTNINPASPITADTRNASWANVTLVGITASCNPVSGLNVSNLTGSSADLTWFSGVGSSVKVEYGLAGFVFGTGISSIETSNSKSITGLTELTSYDFYVKDICGAGDSAAWAGPFRFDTPCYSKIPTYYDDFNVYIPIPDCWQERQGVLSATNTVFTNTTNSIWGQGGFGNYGSSGAETMTISTSTNDEWIISPTVDLGNGSIPYSLEFDVALTTTFDTSPVLFGPNDTLAIVISTDNGVTWNTANILQSWTSGSEPSNLGEHIALDLSAYTGLVKFGFYGGSSGGNVTGCKVYIDNFLVHETPTCAQPTGVSIGVITGWSADLFWAQVAPNTWVEYGPSGFTQGTGTMVVSDSGSITLSGLSGSTDYAFYLIDSCGVGAVSLPTGPYYFTTECSYYTPTYLEDFATWPFDCWSLWEGVLSAGNSTIVPHTGILVWSYDGFANNGLTGSAKVYTYGIINEWLLSPTFDIGNGSFPYQLEFDIAMTTANGTGSSTFDAGDTIALVISQDNGVTWNTANILQTWTPGSEPSNTGEHFIISLAGYTGLVKFGFYAGSAVLGTQSNVYIDNFEIPSCARPNDVEIAVSSATTADVSWTQIATHTIIEYGTTGFTQGTGTIVNSITGTASLSGLLPDTDFDVYIKDSCGFGNESAWGGPYVFSTPCINYVPTYQQDFSTYLPNCWEERQGVLSPDSTTFTDYTASAWTMGGFGNVGSTGAARLNMIGTGGDEWIISPTIDLGNGSIPYQVQFDVALTNYGNSDPNIMQADDSLAFVISLDNGLTWKTTQILKSWTTGFEPSNTGDFELIELTGYTGLVRFGFYAATSVTGGNYNIYVDNFEVKEIPSCQQPIDVNLDTITATTAAISWIQGATHSIVEYGVSGFSPGIGAGTVLTTTTGSVLLTNLTPNTIYDVYVMDSCGVGDESVWSGPILMHTNCEAVQPNYLENFSNYLPDCWSQFSGELMLNSVAITNPYSSLWTEDGFGNVSSTGAARINIYSPASNSEHFEWLVSPSIDLGSGVIDYNLEFDIALTQYLSSSTSTFDADDQFSVVISTDNGLNWTTSGILQTWQSGSEPSNTGDHVMISLLGYTGEVKIGFYAATTGTGGNVNVYIDNFAINECFPSSNSITAIACDSYTAPSGTVYTNSGIYMDTLVNAMGCDSVVTINLTVLSSSTGSLTAVTCGAYVSNAGNTYTSSGIYTEILTNTVGCDSILTLNLTITNINLTIMQNSGVELISNESGSGVMYQWLDCNNGYGAILGETNATYTASVNGSYAIEITKSSCIDTTACVLVNSVNIDEWLISQIKIYPTSTNSHVTIEIPKSSLGEEIQIINVIGEVVLIRKLTETKTIVDVSKFTPGVYIVRIKDESLRIVIGD